MNTYSDKKDLVSHLLEYAREKPFDRMKCTKYFYAQKWDEKIYRFNDEELNRIIDEVSGIDAGDEFFIAQEEIISMLIGYLEGMSKG